MSSSDWSQYQVTVRDLEQITDFNFLSKLLMDVQEAIKTQERRFNLNDLQESASKYNQSLALSLTNLLPTWKGNSSAPTGQEFRHI
jgi:DNA/RNA endonuclease G (NUC1)